MSRPTVLPLIILSLLVLLCFFGVIDSYARDSTIVSFSVGNKYAFAGTRHVHGLPYDTPVSFFTEIVGDSIVGGNRYFRFSSAAFPWRLLGVYDGTPLFRADSTSIYRYNISAEREETIVNFSDTIGTVYSSGNRLVSKTRWPVFREFCDIVQLGYVRIATKLFLIWFEEVGIVQTVADLKAAQIDGVIFGDTTLVSVDSRVSAASDLRHCFLLQNFPNPSNASTMIRYGLPTRSHVKISVYSPLGQEVAQLVNGEMGAGYHEVNFDGKNLSSGVYLYRMQAGSYIQTRRLVLVR